jgi:hypothetical protein
MSNRVDNMPRPVPLSATPMPPIPEHLLPKPSALRITTGTISGRLELAVCFKVTYDFEPGKAPRRSDEQIALSTTNLPHTDLAPGVGGSMKAVPEVLAFNSGTDVIIRAHARSAKPRTVMRVGASIGSHRHFADVMGKRLVDATEERIRFTDPEPFDALPLRYELAYGGVDRAFEAKLLETAKKSVKPEDFRRLGPFARDFLQGVPPVAYPRNRYGKAFALLDDRQKLNGLELPNIEMPDDRLTPARLVPAKASRWITLPVPAGFDYMDALMYPRCAMMGLPPVSEGNVQEIGEVKRGQVPPDFCRGNAFYAEREKVPDLIHPDLSRCAPIGLRLPFLQGNETVLLQGMLPSADEAAALLPGERPSFLMRVGANVIEMHPQLFQLFLDVDKRKMCLIWCARTPWSKPLKPGEDRELLAGVKVRDTWTKTASPR